jgi:hypothetical protein
MHQMTKTLLLSLFFLANTVWALPMDWSGSIGYDSIRLNNYKRTNNVNTSITDGSQEIAGLENDAFVQTYLLRLAPQIIVNDHITFYSELSTGHARGGKVGDNTTVGDGNDTNRDMGAAYYYHTSPNSNSQIQLNQAFVEIYSDIATLKVGRYSKNWGLGAVLNDGKDNWDRFFTYYEGVEAKFNLGKVFITPHWVNLSSQSELTRAGEIRELGISFLYDNPDKETMFGLLASKRKSGSRNQVYKARSNSSTSHNMGATEVTLIDLFYKRNWQRFYFNAEVSLLSGKIGYVYDTTTKSDVKASSYIFESGLKLSERWDLGLQGGIITGDDGASDKFEGMYLNPNYQIAEIMFRYNLRALGNSSSNQNLYDSAISNANFLKFHAHYKKGAWTWNLAYIWAKARETATASQRAYHHDQHYAFTSTQNQKDDLGQEFDLTFDYQWNPNLVLTGVVAYFMPGDYYKFTNDSTNNISLKSQLATGFRLNLSF